LERGQGCNRVPEFNLTSENYVAETAAERPYQEERWGLRNIIRCATFYRQAQILARQGVEIERSTLAHWVGAAAAELQPLHDHLVAQLKASPKLFCDETRCPVLDPGRGKTKTGFMWSLARDDRPWGGTDPPAVAYTYAPGRGAVHAIKLLDGFSG
jgi:transposase